MRNRFTALIFVGLLAFGVAACDTAGTNDTAPGAVDDGLGTEMDGGDGMGGGLEDPTLEPTE
ncbi:hypothetical protein BH23ACT9_BH23ACT9_02800 [soil metagenome]